MAKCCFKTSLSTNQISKNTKVIGTITKLISKFTKFSYGKCTKFIQRHSIKIIQLSTFKTAKKASWGISTLPTCFMRFFTCFFFFQAIFFLTADIATIALCQDIFTHGFNRASCNDLTANRCLNGHIKHLARNQLFHFFQPTDCHGGVHVLDGKSSPMHPPFRH